MDHYDYDLIVIGGGAAGLTCSTGAAQFGAKTLLIEKEKELGGDCLHYGCVPSKSLIKSSSIYNSIKNSSMYGLPDMQVPAVDFQKISDRIKGIISEIQVHDSPGFIKDKYNVDTMFGDPSFVDNHTINIDGKEISSKRFVIATGSSPVIPPIEGIKDISYLTNRDIFFLDSLPDSLIVLGGGPIGLEMAQAFSRLGTRVTVVEFFDKLLPREDEDISSFVLEKLQKDKVVFMLGTKAVKASNDGGEVKLTVKQGEKEFDISAEKILISTGRKPNIEGLSLDDAGIEYDKRGIKVDSRLRTSVKNIFACGDVSGGLQFTHVAGYEGGIAMANAIMRVPVKADYSKVPWCTYLDPEIASIGYNEKRAQEAGIAYTVQKKYFKDNDRALAEGLTEGFLKLLINKKGKIIGVQLVGAHAGELIHEWVAAINGKIGLSTIAQAIHVYPTLSEINKGASGEFLAPKLFNGRVRGILKVLFGLRGVN
jgi:dihydrolipoamide dehydrogenase